MRGHATKFSQACPAGLYVLGAPLLSPGGGLLSDILCSETSRGLNLSAGATDSGPGVNRGIVGLGMIPGTQSD